MTKRFGQSLSISLVDQMVLSAFNLASNAALIALAGAAEFGRFIFAATVILLFTSLQNALVTTPLAIMLPGRGEADALATKRAITSFDALFRIGAGIATVLICAMSSLEPVYLALACLATFTTLARETRRGICFASERTAVALRIDTLAVLFSSMFAVLFWHMLPAADAVLLAIAAGNVGAITLAGRGLVPAHLGIRSVPAAYREVWTATRWSLFGAASSELQHRFYVFALEFFRGLAELGTVQAGRMLLGPMAVVVGALGRVSRPTMARLLAEGDVAGARRIMWIGVGLTLGAGLAYCLAMLVAWRLIEPLIYKGRYPGIELLTVAWAIYTLISVTKVAISAYALAACRLKALAVLGINVSVITSVLLLGLGLDVPQVYPVLAMIAGEIVALVWVIALVRGIDAESIAGPSRADAVEREHDVTLAS
ncbi:MAG: hypothetical protein R3D33_15180 [Hyphomicrobiaceae bacterium]